MNLKHIFPISINYKLKHFFEFINQTIPSVEEKNLTCQKRVFFLDTPAYGNIGDQAIALAMRNFISDILPEYGQIEITEDLLPQSMKWIKSTIKKGDLICLTGGGNMGTLYQRYEAVRRLVIKTFHDYPIVIFPQTFDYDDSRYSQKELKNAKKIYSLCDKLILCARDEHSYNIMRNTFPNIKVIFCPDIVLYMDYKNNIERKYSVGLCLRNDKEKSISEDFSACIKSKYKEANYISTTKNLSNISWKNRENIVNKVLTEFAQNQLVITDRLHGVIFSYITNTPCIALPNSNGKVEYVCNYLQKSGNVFFCKHKDDLQKHILKNHQNNSLKQDFHKLADNIKKYVNKNEPN